MTTSLKLCQVLVCTHIIAKTIFLISNGCNTSPVHSFPTSCILKMIIGRGTDNGNVESQTEVQ